MKDDKLQEIDLDEIMEKIRKEVEKNKSADHSPGNGAKDLGPREKLSIVDLTKYHDEQFIKNAYRSILHREPDHEGAHDYLTKLRYGHLNKIEILGRLRYSKEGRSKHIRIQGLLLRTVVDSSFRIPVVRYITQFLYLLVRCPKIFEYVRMFEALKSLRQADVQKIEALRESFATFSQKTLKTFAETHTETRNAFTEMRNAFTETRNALSSKVDAQKDSIDTLSRHMSDQKLSLLDEQRRVTFLLEEARKRFPEPVSPRQLENMLTEEDHILDAMYLTFEDRFRGTREDIKERLKTYLPYIEQAAEKNLDASLLDLGCGRGEWLELLKERGYKAQGIDLNRVMTHQCTELGLDVIEADAIEFLIKQKENTYSVITGFHIVEHLPLKALIALLDEARRVLIPGGMIILETPNPENLIVGSCNFYTDPTHRTPIPPNPLKFFVEQRGFVDILIVRLHKVKEVLPTGQALIDEVIQRYNMEQDYAIIGYKK
jgi:2-polyprenyl-3-methyl-5-hydroxy-6-metoxy-1,4-benzoquinol methylase